MDQQLLLERSDLLQLSPISHRDTLQLLAPSQKSNRQKIVVGDDTGTIYCYDFKKGEPICVFETKAFETEPVTCITIGGDNPLKRDKIFASAGQQIVGISKKGKNFFTMSSSLTEAIQTIHTEDTWIWTSCEYICNVYDNGKDRDLYMSMDRINAMCVGHIVHEDEYDTVLACQDSCVRIVKGSQLYVDIPTTSPLKSVALLSHIHNPNKAGAMLVIGTEGGDMTLLRFPQKKDSARGLKNNHDDYLYEWTVEDSQHSAIISICICELIKGQGTNIVVGREDGRVEVYAQDLVNSEAGSLAAPGLQTAAPRKVFSHDIGERIQSLVCGHVNSETFQEIVCASYSGKIISFTTEPLRIRDENDTYGRSVATLHNENRIKHLEGEIESMRTKVGKERTVLQKAKDTAAKNASKNGTVLKKMAGGISAATDFAAACTFILDREKGAYVLSIEVQRPLDLVVVRSSVDLEVADQDADLNTLVSVTPAALLGSGRGADDEKTGRRSGEIEDCKFIAALRVPKGEKRALFAVRPIEGEHGEILVTIVTDETPKLAKVIKYPLRRLSLHTRVHPSDMKDEEYARPRCVVKFSGTFSINVVHEWLQDIMAEVPPHLEENATDLRLLFRNSFTGAIAVVHLMKDEITFESQSASAVAIFKEGLTSLATKRRITIQEKVDITDESVFEYLQLLRPHVDRLLMLALKVTVVDAVAEVVHAETGGNTNEVPPWLTNEYAELYRETKQIRAELKSRHKRLEYISGIITDLHVDWHKLRGIDARNKLPEVADALRLGDWDRLVSLIMGGKKTQQPVPRRGFVEEPTDFMGFESQPVHK